MRLSKLGLRQHSRRKVIVWPRDMCQSYVEISIGFPYLGFGELSVMHRYWY
ncbi:hypothetical protein Gotur_029303 [Gossypium turneri]